VRNTFLELDTPLGDDSVDAPFFRQQTEPVRGSQATHRFGSRSLRNKGSNEALSPDQDTTECSSQAGSEADDFPTAAPKWARYVTFCPDDVDVSTVAGTAVASLEDLPPLGADEDEQPDGPSGGDKGKVSSTRTKPGACPNCGAGVDATYRFCPCCCYQLKQFEHTTAPPATYLPSTIMPTVIPVYTRSAPTETGVTPGRTEALR